MLEFNFRKYNKYIEDEDFDQYREKNLDIKRRFSSDLSHWMDINTYVKPLELQKIKDVAAKIRDLCDVFVVIGIGGSYMGAKAVIEAFSSPYHKDRPEIIFLGKNINSNEYVEVLDYLKDKSIAVNVISKSGTTLEPSIAFVNWSMKRVILLLSFQR